MQKIVPSLWFDNNAEEAVNFYLSIFKDAKVLQVSRYTEAGPGPAGSVLAITFHLQGQEFFAINGGPHFKFTPAVSFYVKCDNQPELDYYWDHLLVGGEAQQCGWLRDKYGLSWQIIPAILQDLMTDQDSRKVEKVTRAMLQMVKLDVAGLLRAYTT